MVGEELNEEQGELETINDQTNPQSEALLLSLSLIFLAKFSPGNLNDLNFHFLYTAN